MDIVICISIYTTNKHIYILMYSIYMIYKYDIYMYKYIYTHTRTLKGRSRNTKLLRKNVDVP